MSRLRQIREIDYVIERITTVTGNGCSLSNQDSNVLLHAIEKLQKLKKKKGKTNKEIQRITNEALRLLENL